MDAFVVTAWQERCQLLSPAFTKPTFFTFFHLISGWVLCRSQPAVTNLIRTLGPDLLGQTAKHGSSYEHFFYRAAWNLQDLSRLLLQRLIVPLLRRQVLDAEVQLNIDGGGRSPAATPPSPAAASTSPSPATSRTPRRGTA